jgi:hypothetical protein
MNEIHQPAATPDRPWLARGRSFQAYVLADDATDEENEEILQRQKLANRLRDEGKITTAELIAVTKEIHRGIPSGVPKPRQSGELR